MVEIDTVWGQQLRIVERWENRLRQEHGEKRQLLEVHVPSDCEPEVTGEARERGRGGGKASNFAHRDRASTYATTRAHAVKKLEELGNTHYLQKQVGVAVDRLRQPCITVTFPVRELSEGVFYNK